MRGALWIALVGAAITTSGVVLVGAGCLGKPRFECSAAADCQSSTGNGQCEADGFCSFPDGACPSGRRYGDLSGPHANQCVGVPPDGPPPPDAAPDAYVHDARECFGTGAYMLCFAGMPPMGDVSLAGALDTSTDARCAAAMPQSWSDAGQPDACLILGKSISITSALTVTGARPLVLLGDTITITATVDVAAHRGATAPAPGAPATTCAAFPTAPGNALNGAGGGAGGSFMRAGGSGGRGVGAGALGGTAAPADTVAPTILRGGCAGQIGGTGAAAAGAPGGGGGAIFLTASRITITGTINASGAGGVGGGVLSGGSGGGSGGMIVLHAVESITATGARLLANGGGGSGGASNVAGLPGSDPAATAPTTPAPGGNGPGGAGGDGFAGTTAAQPGGNAGGNRDTGGGGGGGGGYIQTNIALTGATVSPAATLVP